MKILKLLLLLVFFSLVLGQFGRLPVLSGGTNIYLQDLAVFFLVLGVFLHLLISRRIKQSLFDGTVLAGGAYIFWALASFIYNSQWLDFEKNVVGFSYLARFWLYFLVYFVLVQILREGGIEIRRWVIKILIFSGLVLAVSGFIQLMVLPDLSVLSEYGYDPHKNRLVTTFLDPNFSGAYIVLSLNLLLSVPFFGSSARYWKVGLLLIALILTFSRSAWLMFAVSVFVFGLFRSRKMLLAAFFIGFLAYFLVPRVQTRIAGITDPDDSAKLRFVSWQRAVTIAKNSPILGVGFNNFRSAQEEQGFFDFNIPEGGRAGAGSDSSFLLVLATTGVVGFFLYLIFYLTLAARALRGLLSGDAVSLGLFVSLVGLLLESNFINSLFFTPILLWVFIAAAVSSTHPSQRPA